MGGTAGERAWGRELAGCLTGPTVTREYSREDAAALVEAAQRHRMATVLRTRQQAIPFLPRPVAAKLDTMVRLEHLVTIQLRRQLVEIAEAMQAAGIELIVLKGLANTVLAPGQPRNTGDHDLLVRPDQLDRAATVMAGLGYVQQATEFGSIEHYRTHHHHDAPWVHQRHRHPVEIHHHPLAIDLSPTVAVEGLWNRSVPLSVDGVTVRRLGDVDQVLHLAVHATEDGPDRRLRDLWELAGWAGRLDAREWAQLVDQVRDPRLARRVWAGLASVRATLGIEPDHDAVQTLAERGGLSARRRRRWCELAARTALDEIPPRWQGWPAKASIEAGSSAAAALAAVGAAVRCGRTSAERQVPGPGGRARRAALTVAGVVLPLFGGRRRPRGAALRRSLDVIGAVLLAVVTLPVVLVLGAVAAVRSPGPLLYRQVRVGRHGERFELLKLRTMPADAEDSSGPMLSPVSDPRVIGGFATVRRLHLDELPQLWNVLRGEMSLVGPRPERPEFTRVLQRSIPCYAERHHLAPGLTGLAQITLGYHAAPAGKLAHDLDWVRHPGVWRYLHIALATPWSIVRGPADRDSDPAFDHPGVIDLTEPEEVASSVA